MGHVGPDKVSSGERRAQTELTGENGGGDDARQLAGVLTGVGGVSSTNAKQVEHGTLGFKDSTTTDGTHLNTRHRNSDLEVTVVAKKFSLVSLCRKISNS
jgi:hypothetical protein